MTDRRLYYGWTVVGASFLGSFVVFGLSYSFGIFLEDIVASFDGSRGLTSLAFGVQTVALYLGASGLGVVIDRYGTRRSVIAGAVLTAVGLGLASRAPGLPSLIFTYGILTGVGLSVVYVVSYTTVTRWFDRRLGFAGGLASAGLGVGMLVVVPSATWLLAQAGWRDVLGVLAVAAGAILLIAGFLIRDDPLSAGAVPPTGEFVGKPPTPNRQPLNEQLAAVTTIARRPSFGLLFVGWVLIYGTLYVVLAHLVLHGVTLGLSRRTGAVALALVGLSSALGRVGIGYVADMAGHRRIFVICSAVMGLTTVWLVVIETALGILMFATIFGLAYGGNGALLSPLTADFFGRTNINAVFGLISLSFGLSGLVAPAAAGATYDAVGSYEPAFLAAGIAAIIGAGSVAVAGQLVTET